VSELDVISINTETLKLFGAIFALFISTIAVEFRIADFINSKRDNFPKRRQGKLNTLGECYDWCWGYVLGLIINFTFLAVALKLKNLTENTEFSTIGLLVFIFYSVNLVLWILGFIIDMLRIMFPGQNRE
jgi:hypothetical protein